jgi:tetratricopeptide (TPR) repeat protein
MAHRNGTPVIISTVVSNLRDCAPFASLHSLSLSPDDAPQWQQWFDAGCAAMDQGRWSVAADAFEQAATLDDAHAELQYRIAQCRHHLGDFDRARFHFQLALDYDTLRFRADSNVNRIIADAATDRSEQALQLIDAAKILAEAQTDGIAGRELLYEHVHLNFHGNYLLAKCFANELVKTLQLTDGATTQSDWASELECARQLGWTPYHQMRVAREMEVRLNSAPFTEQSDHVEQMKYLRAEIDRLGSLLNRDAARDATELYRGRISACPDDWMLRQQFGYLLESLDNLPAAIEQWQVITQLLPHYAEAHCQLGVLLNRARQYRQAEQALTRALMLRHDYARAHNSLGICLSHLERYADSYRQFARAIELNPLYAEAQQNWGLVLANQGQDQAAAAHFRAALAADPDYLPAHQRLGEGYVRSDQLDEALPHYEAIVRLRPNDPAAQVNLGLLYLKQKQPAKAIAVLEHAAAQHPDNTLAKQALTQARRVAQQSP